MRLRHTILLALTFGLLGIAIVELAPLAHLSTTTRQTIGLTLFAANLVLCIYGAMRSHRIAWSAYLLLSLLSLTMLSASTPISAAWLALKLI